MWLPAFLSIVGIIKNGTMFLLLSECFLYSENVLL